LATFFAILFFVVIFIQFVYWVFIFARLIWHQNEDSNIAKPGVSIIIAAWNEMINLQELIPLLEKQNYPDFEIIIADDRSFDGTYDMLWIEKPYPKTKIVRIESTPPHFTSKKYAVTMGMKKATKELALLTDADCRPTSENWLSEMVAQYGGQKQIVLGFSPYYQYAGWLNAFIRFETFHTAVQYFSLAKIGLPFMGVGRNLMYNRDLFWHSNGFASHHGVLGGDDDLFINENANDHNTAICLSEESMVYSEPKRTMEEWITQKRRHLSVGKFYKMKDKIILGLYSTTHILSYLLIPFAFLANPSWFQAPDWARIPLAFFEERNLQDFYPFTDWLRLILGVTITWFLIKWLIMWFLNKRLFKTIPNRSLLVFDFLYVVYLLTVGTYSLLSRRQKIRWR
jgi:glycosyltransferase involved in cell wall biosynthesis